MLWVACAGRHAALWAIWLPAGGAWCSVVCFSCCLLLCLLVACLCCFRWSLLPRCFLFGGGLWLGAVSLLLCAVLGPFRSPTELKWPLYGLGMLHSVMDWQSICHLPWYLRGRNLSLVRCWVFGRPNIMGVIVGPVSRGHRFAHCEEHSLISVGRTGNGP